MWYVVVMTLFYFSAFVLNDTFYFQYLKEESQERTTTTSGTTVKLTLNDGDLIIPVQKVEEGKREVWKRVSSVRRQSTDKIEKNSLLKIFLSFSSRNSRR
jgi:hypothetical protein